MGKEQSAPTKKAAEADFFLSPILLNKGAFHAPYASCQIVEVIFAVSASRGFKLKVSKAAGSDRQEFTPMCSSTQ